MQFRSGLSGFVMACFAGALIGCGTPQGLDSVAVSPSSQSLTIGQSIQFLATGTYGNAAHPTSQNITGSVTWSSSLPSVATVNSSGLATAVSAGTTAITATATGYAGPVSSSAVLTVPASTTGGSSGSSGSGNSGGSGANIVSLTIIPSGINFGQLTEDGQFLAIGTFTTPPLVRDLTNSASWFSSEPNLFPVSNYSPTAPTPGSQNGGVVTAYGSSQGANGATITAEATDSTGSIATATATVGCAYAAANPAATPPVLGTCNANIPQLLSTLTVYNEGLNATNWLITAPSATGTPAVIDCGPGAGTNKSVCTATYPIGTTVILTAPAQSGVKFGGWSSNCTNTGTITQAGPNTCTINLGFSDATVGAIFN